MSGSLLQFRDDYLNYRDTVALRLLLLLGIFLFHAGYEFGYVFPNAGYTFVAGFFFLSGFGLEYSVSHKKGYLSNFLQKRVFGILIQFWIIQAIAAIVLLIVFMDPQMSYDRVVTALLRHPIWFITELVVFYVLFFFGCMFKDRRMKILFIFVGSVLLMMLMTDYYASNLYLKSGAAFIFGIVWCMFRDRIDAFIKKYYAPVMIITLVVLFTTHRFFTNIGDLVVCGITCVFSMIILCMACMIDAKKSWFVPLILIVLGSIVCWYRTDTGLHSEGALMVVFAGIATICYCFNRLQDAMAFWGNMSFEFYVMHFLPLDFIYPEMISDKMLGFVISLVLSFVLTYLTWRVVRFVLSKYNQGLARFEEESRCQSS